MTKRVHVAISMQPEDQEKLKAMSDKLGMKPSELVREMVDKLEADEVTQQIILNKFWKENKDSLGRERLLRIMSIRTNLKKSGANSNHDAGPASLTGQDKNNAYDRVSQTQDNWEEMAQRHGFANAKEMFAYMKVPYNPEED